MDTFDVVVVGSGAFGASTAFHLAKAGRRVALVDQAALGSQTSPRAAGLTGQLRRTDIMMELARRSVDKMVHFTTETGLPIEYVQAGSLIIARTPEHAAGLNLAVENGRRFGLDVAMISPEAARDRMPILEMDGIHAVSFTPTDLHLEPEQIALGYANAAASLGCSLMPDTRVTGIVVEGGRVNRVLTERGELHALAVVDAAGGWLRLVGNMAGVSLPVVPTRHQLLITEPMRAARPDMPTARVIDANAYVRPCRGGLMFGGYEQDPVTVDLAERGPEFRIDDLALDIAVLRRLIKSVEGQFPLLKDAPVREHRGGLPTMTPDGFHLVGPAPGVSGLYIIGGCNVGGLSVSPALGEVLAGWIAEGKSPDLDMSVMSPARFTQGIPTLELLERCRLQYANYYTGQPRDVDSQSF
ncbi:NAD(P)/FAD-dependent oxidoreductase [Nitrospirillum viridazoti]|uniref:FAD-dependent oxidoreductase n=1 Tax=Nitrospirillum viridazoti CBAmc TaxID=1441467 RepID=A0A248JVN7_9PROT|nr:FAD-binding oxidoreductase [Nitrospirillum amazonense]ASG22188.1 FAD-dependent oxidoreductase [Nitrospirillum amazonense CBAmc]TWB31052.1 sarcosine oxidase subunit beta/4-methylaminobutanoate oxidase (formaldehyde-forming) [Nitrospirillum amazonense]